MDDPKPAAETLGEILARVLSAPAEPADEPSVAAPDPVRVFDQAVAFSRWVADIEGVLPQAVYAALACLPDSALDAVMHEDEWDALNTYLKAGSPPEHGTVQ